MKRAVMLFAKAPIAGYSKTRLRGYLPDEKIVELSKALILHNLHELKKTDIDIFIFSPYHPKNDTLEKLTGYEINLQEGEGLGERMANAFRKVFANNYDKVMILGSDLVDVDADLINEAFNLLDSKEVVFSPAEDGGYTLLAMRELREEIFKGKVYSTENVSKDLIDELESSSISYEVLRESRDLDDNRDLKYFRDYGPKWIKDIIGG